MKFRYRTTKRKVDVMKKTILSYGEILWDIFPTGEALGGAPFNLAYRANSLGENGLCVSRLGQDVHGQRAYDAAEKLGLKTDLLQWDDRFPTGTVVVSFDANHNPDYLINPNVAYDHIELTEELVDAAARADCICFGTLIQRSETSAHTLEQLLEISPVSLKFLDINLRNNCYSDETIITSLESTDILKLNDAEAVLLPQLLNFRSDNIPHFCEIMIEKWALSYCLVTLSARGVFAMSFTGEQIYVPGYKLEVTDAVGAGDALSAGFVKKILDGKKLKEACEFSNRLGALSVTKKSATAPITEAELNEFQKQQTARNVMSELERFIE